MSLILREVNNRSWFLNELVAREYTWLLRHDIQADAFKGVRTTRNTLSVFELEDSSQDAIDRTLAALAGTRDHVPDLHYVLINKPIVEDLGFEMERTQGKTLDSEVNQWHLDVVKLNSDRLAVFCQALRKSGQFERKRPNRVAKLLRQAIDLGRFDHSQIKPEMLESMGRLL